MRGRKPVPRALKILRGNPGHRPLADDEPLPSTEIDLAVPAILADDPDARAEWDSKAPMLHRLGLLTEADLDGLVMYCATFARWKTAERELRRFGMIVSSKQYPYPIISPWLIIANKSQQQCRAMLLEFGLTPVSRSRVHVPKKQTPDAQRERFFGAGPHLITSPKKRR